MYQCCIFDLDGTLINSLRSIEHTVNVTLEHFGLTPINDEQVKAFIGDGYQKLIERALVFGGDAKLHYAEQAFAQYRQNFEKYASFEIEAYEGIREMLSYLKERRIKLAVLSNKLHERAVQNVEMIFGKDYFDLVFGERPGIKIKPDPEGIEIILAQLGIAKDQCLYFGDTNTDMRTGLAAGVDTVGVTWGFRDQEELSAFHPRYLISHPQEVKTRVVIPEGV